METLLQKNIKNRLTTQKISITELERRIGIRHAVINILHGRSKNPSVHLAQAIAKALGCNIEELLTENPNSSQLPVKSEHNELLSTTTPHTWNATLATQAIAAISQYLQANQLTPPCSKIFNCIEEIYKYSYNEPKQPIDPKFVSWIADKLFNNP